MWLKHIQSMYVSRENYETILHTSIQIIFNKTGKKLDENNKILFEIFNTIASQVFSVESKNPLLQKQSPEQAIQIINGIVIEELVKYILHKKPELLKNTEAVQTKGESTRAPLEETIKLSIEKTVTKFTSPIENVISMNILTLYMYTQDYIVTEINNTLVFDYNNERFVAKIQPRNYTEDTVLQAVQEAIFECIKKKIDVKISEYDNKVIIAKEIKINEELSTLNDILGIGTGNPMKLIKRNKINLGVKFEFENEINNFDYYVPIIINNNEISSNIGPILKEFKLNYTKKFNRPVDLAEVKIDFDKYNHRGYPFYLMLEITKLV